MREFGIQECSFWEDSRIQSLDSLSVRLAAYLNTSRHTTSFGIFRMPIEYIIGDFKLKNDSKNQSDPPEYCDKCHEIYGYHTGIDTPIIRVKRAFEELESVQFLAYDHIKEWVYIKDFLREEKISNIKHAQGIIKMFSFIPNGLSFEKDLIFIIKVIENKFDIMKWDKIYCKPLYRYHTGIDTPTIPVRYNRDIERDRDINKPPFIPPCEIGQNLNTEIGDKNVQKKTRGNIAKVHWASCRNVTATDDPETSDAGGLGTWQGD